MFSSRQNQLSVAAHKQRDALSRNLLAKANLSNQVKAFTGNPVNLLLPYTIGLLGAARQIKKQPGERSSINTGALLKLVLGLWASSENIKSLWRRVSAKASMIKAGDKAHNLADARQSVATGSESGEPTVLDLYDHSRSGKNDQIHS